MTAVGGDPTAVKQNPAGLGIYRHSQFSISGDGSFRRFSQDGLGLPDPWYSRDFATAYNDIEEGCKGLLNYLKEEML